LALCSQQQQCGTFIARTLGASQFREETNNDRNGENLENYLSMKAGQLQTRGNQLTFARLLSGKAAC